MDLLDKMGYTLAGVGCALGLFLGYTIWGDKKPENVIPYVTKVQQGYVAPADISIRVEDLDKDGELQTIQRMDGIDYLVVKDESGCHLQRYEVLVNPED